MTFYILNVAAGKIFAVLRWYLELCITNACLLLQNLPQVWQLCPAVCPMCLLSMWLQRLVRFVFRSQSPHCHIPPPIEIIFVSIMAASSETYSTFKISSFNLKNYQMFYFSPLTICVLSKIVFWNWLNFFMKAMKVRNKRVLSSTEPMTMHAAVACRLLDVLWFDVVVQVGRLGSQLTVCALPQTSTKVHHFCTNFCIHITQVYK